jgi:predicted small lipoprotein YifL
MSSQKFGQMFATVRQGLILLLVVLALAGCGKKGNPQPPPGEPDTYPRTYPSE